MCVCGRGNILFAGTILGIFMFNFIIIFVVVVISSCYVRVSVCAWFIFIIILYLVQHHVAFGL